MKITRHQDWPRRLHEAIQAEVGEPFAWGRADCALTACSIVQQVRLDEVDLGEELRGRYDSAAGAMRRMVELVGGKSIADTPVLDAVCDHLAEQHEIAEIRPLAAQRGDLVLADTDDGPALGVVDLDGRFGLFRAIEGWARVPIKACRRAWRV